LRAERPHGDRDPHQPLVCQRGRESTGGILEHLVLELASERLASIGIGSQNGSLNGLTLLLQPVGVDVAGQIFKRIGPDGSYQRVFLDRAKHRGVCCRGGLRWGGWCLLDGRSAITKPSLDIRDKSRGSWIACQRQRPQVRELIG